MKSAPHYLYIGVDPGYTGAIALLEDVEGEEYARVHDMPVHKPGVQAKTRIDREAVAKLIRLASGEGPRRKAVAVVEAVAAMGGKGRKEGAQSMFRFGQGQGEILGILSGLGVFTFEIPPGTWKAKAGLIKASEREVCKRALELFPGQELFGPRGGPLHGRAEALFLAAYARMLVERKEIYDRNR